MNVSPERSISTYYLTLFLFWPLLMFCGCAHVEKQAPGAAEVKKLVETSTTMEKHGDVAGAAEDLEIALIIDPDNSKARKELDRLIADRNGKARQHYNAGIALLNSNSSEARKEFLNALRIRPDYAEAITALRDLQFATAEAIIQARIKKETSYASAKGRRKAQTEDEDLDTETYSLDIAVSAFEDGDYATAIQEFGKMKERYPNDPDIQAYLDRAFYGNGIALFNRNNYSKALESFSRVPKGFDNVDDYIARCRQALKPVTGKKKK